MQKYTLIVSEKPSAAKRIAASLAEGKVEQIKHDGVASYKITRGGKSIVVASAAGHLFVLSNKDENKSWTYPVFDVDWKPTYGNKNSFWSKKYFDNLKSLANGADSFISACDYDTEGSVIAYNIIRYICKAKDGKRMKFSTLTEQDLVKAYETASAHLDFEQIEAGIARHYLDFFWGINISRALTLALKAAGGYYVLSTGRVQGPMLALLKQREQEIRDFKAEPYWEIVASLMAGKESLMAIHEKGKFWKEPEAKQVHAKCNQKKGTVKQITKSRIKQSPPFPFDLTTLQREAYRHFRFSPKQTLDIAQSLYEMAVISYPRTSSQKLPAAIGYKGIINNLWKQKAYKEICEKLLTKKLEPNEGKKEDPAHPAIFPTGTVPKKTDSRQQKVYDLIVRRFLACFEQAAIRESVNVKIDIGSEVFAANGITTIEENWLATYHPYSKQKEELLPPLKEGQQLEVKKVELLAKETTPPPRYSQAGLLKKLEELNLGTKGTRALILQTLYDREYIKESTIQVTKLGESVILALEKFSDEIISIELTRRFEDEMEEIREGKKNKEQIIEEAIVELTKVLEKFKKKEKEIGAELLRGVKNVMAEERAKSIIGKCTCGGNLLVRMSRNRKRFIGCDSYPKCTQTFSLPQKGKLVALENKKCEKCGLAVLQIRNYKRKPYELCVRDGFVTKFGAAKEQAEQAQANEEAKDINTQEESD